MFRRLFTLKMINWSLPFSSYPNTDCPTWCRQIGAAHRVEIVAVGQVAAHQLGSQVFADFVAQVGIPYCNRLPAHIVGVCLFSITCLVVIYLKNRPAVLFSLIIK